MPLRYTAKRLRRQPVIQTWAATGSLGHLTALGLQLLVRPVLVWWPLNPLALQTTAVLDHLARLLPQSPGTRVEPVRFDEFDAEWVHPVDDALENDITDRAVLYFHGGGFVAGSPRTHRRLVAGITRAAGAPALSVDYRMLPATDLVGSVADGLEAYRWLLETGHDPARIVLAGDSAGGTLAFTVTLQAIAAGLPKPAGIVALSPWLDFDETAKAQHRNAASDAYIPAERIADLGRKLLGELPPAAASPVNARLKQLPPCLIQVSESEVLFHDAELMAQRLARAGVPCSLQVWEGRIHVFQMFADLVPEGQLAIDEIGAFIRDVMDRHGRPRGGWRGRRRWSRLRNAFRRRHAETA